MTRPAPNEALARIVAQCRAVLLDFDGPVCPVFAGGLNAKIAEQMRTVLRATGIQPPSEVEATPDPLVVLWFAYDLGHDDLTARVEEAFRTGERHAVRTATPTPYAHQAIAACHESGRPIVIVSNNDADAIGDYLDRHHLTHYIQDVVGRAYARPDLMKPHPAPVDTALDILQAPAHAAVLIGDSLTDIEVARATGLHSIGYAKTPDRRPGLEAAGADTVIDTMHDLTEAFRTDPAGPLLD